MSMSSKFGVSMLFFVVRAYGSIIGTLPAAKTRFLLLFCNDIFVNALYN